MQRPKRPTGEYLEASLRSKYGYDDILRTSGKICSNIDEYFRARSKHSVHTFTASRMATEIAEDYALVRALVAEICGGTYGARIAGEYEWR